MLLLALTGSLATGKSTVSNILSSPPHSLPIIDADLLARKAVEPGTRGYRRIISHFGPTTPDLLLPSSDARDVTGSQAKGNKENDSKAKREAQARGRPLNRAALGRRVFGSTRSRTRDRKFLNSIVHPFVRWQMCKLVLHYFVSGHWAAVLDIPLLYDSGLDNFAPVVMMVAVSDPKIQMQRLRVRDPHLSEQEARDRVESQGGVEEKVKRTEARGRGRGWVVWNDGDKKELEREVGRAMESLEKGRRGVWTWVFLVIWPLTVGWAIFEVWRGWRGRRRWESRKAAEEKKV
ncbi:MAG: hypothetical protein Q9201_004398 [Fulgogasparrea decipioides]